MRAKLKTYPVNGLPVLPEGLWWDLQTSHRPNAPVTLSIHKGNASHNGSSTLSSPVASVEVSERWHWLVRSRGRRLYRKTFDANGELLVREKKPVERFEDRYRPSAQFRSLHPEA